MTVILLPLRPSLPPVAGAFPSPDPEPDVATNAHAEKSYDLTSSAEEREEECDRRARPATSPSPLALPPCRPTVQVYCQDSGKGEAGGGFEENVDDDDRTGWRKPSPKTHATFPHCIVATIRKSDGTARFFPGFVKLPICRRKFPNPDKNLPVRFCRSSSINPKEQ